MSQTQFTFINSTKKLSLLHQHNDNLPTIRAHAMRAVRRQKRLDFKTPTPSQPKVDNAMVPEEDEARTLTHRSPQPPTTNFTRLLQGTFLGTTIARKVLSLDVLQYLDYFLHDFTPSTFPTSHIQYRCGILEKAMSEGQSSLIYGLCALGAIYRAIANESVASVNLESAYRYYKQRAMKALRMRLANASSLQNSDSLAIVVLLLLIETVTGDLNAAEIHRSGLVQLTRGHYGILSASNPLVSDIIMSDVKAATSSLSLPSIPLDKNWTLEFDRLLDLRVVSYGADRISLGVGFTDTEILPKLGSRLLQAFSAMRNLIIAVEVNLSTSNSESYVNGVHFLVLEHELLSITSCAGVDDVQNPHLAESCRLGALLYFNLWLWSWPKHSTLVLNLLSGLRKALSYCNTVSDSKQQQQLLLWLYWMGALASIRMSDRQWYLSNVSAAANRLKLRSEDDHRYFLSRFFFVERLMGQDMRDSFILLQQDL